MAKVGINFDLCDNTQNCAAVCPENVFVIVDSRTTVAHAGECTLCAKCLECCPEGAIELDF
ncbi:MAG: ferredoxin [Acidobacteriota bacterium]|nr:MAG: ferredoxin [Acidobacteriota bacterium]